MLLADDPVRICQRAGDRGSMRIKLVLKKLLAVLLVGFFLLWSVQLLILLFSFPTRYLQQVIETEGIPIDLTIGTFAGNAVIVALILASYVLRWPKTRSGFAMAVTWFFFASAGWVTAFLVGSLAAREGSSFPSPALTIVHKPTIILSFCLLWAMAGFFLGPLIPQRRASVERSDLSH
ncbi:hypothetical protein [Oryzifoliimicrobium ureilyticus]|uniref:hypothetical protein n=1 Tax=Oryzifoliimicrobium ureilyticus TaxID=3113724 RepID=UPI0030766821